MGEGLADVSGERIVVYVSIGVVVLLALATATDKGLGPITRWWYSFARDRRQAAADGRTAAYDELMAQVTDLRRQLRYSRGEHAKEMAKVRESHDLELAELRHDIAALRAEVRSRDELVQQHLPWDRNAVDRAARHGEDLGPPPPLWPV